MEMKCAALSCMAWARVALLTLLYAMARTRDGAQRLTKLSMQKRKSALSRANLVCIIPDDLPACAAVISSLLKNTCISCVRHYSSTIVSVLKSCSGFRSYVDLITLHQGCLTIGQSHIISSGIHVNASDESGRSHIECTVSMLAFATGANMSNCLFGRCLSHMSGMCQRSTIN